MKIFFPDFDSTYWMKTHADSFENGKVVFDEKLKIHKLGKIWELREGKN